MNTNPNKLTIGATTMRRTLKMSGSKYPSVDPGPVINKNPRMIIAIPTANRMKLVLSNANFWLSLSYLFFTI